MILAMILLAVLGILLGLLGLAAGYASGLLKGLRDQMFTIDEMHEARQEALFHGVMHSSDAVVALFEEVLDRRGHGELAAIRREVEPRLQEVLIDKALELGVGPAPAEEIGNNDEEPVG